MKAKTSPAITYFEKYLDIAPFALALWRSIEAKEVASIKKRFKYQPPILDVGCGFGEFAGVFADSVIEVGIDISPTDLLRAAQGKKYKHLYIDDARKLSFPKNSFQTAISVSVLEHIPRAKEAIKEIYRVLKRNGLFIATIPTDELYNQLFFTRVLNTFGLSSLAKIYYRAINKSFKHINLWPKTKWEKIIREAGFSILESRKIISPTATRIFDIFLITALPSQIGRWLAGNRLIWGLGWKKRLLTKIFASVIEAESNSGSNIIIVAKKDG